MVSWFTFGGIRGVLGAIIFTILTALFGVAAIQQSVGTATVSVSTWESVPTVIETLKMYLPLLLATPTYVVASAVIATMVVSFIVCGIQYWLGAKIVNALGVRVSGVWKAMMVGIVGGFVLTMLFAPVLVYLAAPKMGQMQAMFAASAAIVAIPVALAIEVVMAALTWYLLEYAGWKLPE